MTIAAAGAVPARTGCDKGSSNMAEGKGAEQILPASADPTAAPQAHRVAITAAVAADLAAGAVSGRMGDIPAQPAPSKARAA